MRLRLAEMLDTLNPSEWEEGIAGVQALAVVRSSAWLSPGRRKFYVLSDSTSRSMSSSRFPVLGRSRCASLSLSSALVRSW